jgi:hypothetical protein
MKMLGASSVNLRSAMREGKDRTMDPVCFECSVCGVRRWLGKTASALVRLQCEIDGQMREWLVCGRCIDVIVDMTRFGPRVMREGHKWRLCSRVVRVSLVDERLVCLTCWNVDDSHLFVKYDDMLVGGDAAVYVTRKVCFRCIASFVEMMKGEAGLRMFKFPMVKMVAEG